MDNIAAIVNAFVVGAIIFFGSVYLTADNPRYALTGNDCGGTCSVINIRSK